MNREPGREKQSLALQAYYDGELSRFAHWRMQRRLRSSPELQRELAQLAEFSKLVREVDAADAPHPVSDSWSEIGPSLAGIDREIETERGTGSGLGWMSDGSSGNRSGWGLGPVAVAGALAVLVLAVITVDLGVGGVDGVVDVAGVDSEGAVPVARAEAARGSLRYLKTNGVSYLVARDSDDVTIIWLMDSDTPAEGA
jgi:hypothetical protein